jgi:hypothetical protein
MSAQAQNGPSAIRSCAFRCQHTRRFLLTELVRVLARPFQHLRARDAPRMLRCQHVSTICGKLLLDASVFYDRVMRSRSLEVLSRGIAKAERDAASRALPCTQFPGGSGTPPSATTSGRDTSAFTRVFDPLGRSQTVKPSCFAPRGPDATNPAVERREASVLRYWTRGASQRLRTTVTGPPKGAAAPERLSALRSLIWQVREQQTSEGQCLARRMMLVRTTPPSFRCRATGRALSARPA